MDTECLDRPADALTAPWLRRRSGRRGAAPNAGNQTSPSFVERSLLVGRECLHDLLLVVVRSCSSSAQDRIDPFAIRSSVLHKSLAGRLDLGHLIVRQLEVLLDFLVRRTPNASPLQRDPLSVPTAWEAERPRLSSSSLPLWPASSFPPPPSSLERILRAEVADTGKHFAHSRVPCQWPP